MERKSERWEGRIRLHNQKRKVGLDDICIIFLDTSEISRKDFVTEMVFIITRTNNSFSPDNYIF
jgi:hypothetical protein